MNRKYLKIILLACCIVISCSIRFWWITAPCVRYYYRNNGQLTKYSESLINDYGTLKKQFPLPDWLMKSEVSDVELYKDHVDFTYYRYYTFPDGAMDHLVFSENGTLPSNLRKPIDSVRKLSNHWFYVETE